MLQLRKRILVGVLCSAMVLTASQSVAWSESAEAPSTSEAGSAESVDPIEEDIAGEDTADSDEDAPDDEPAAQITEEEALSKCKLYAENSNYVLYVNESTGVFALKVKENGYIWWSNPYNADNDPVANNSRKQDLKSSIVMSAVKVTDTEAPSTTLRSFNDCVEKGGMTIEAVENGFRATYNFNNEGILIPYYVTIDDEGLAVSIAVDEIVEQEALGNIREATRSIVTVNLVQDFGAAYSDEDGYIITPDGSGAVIKFNNGKTNTSEYSQKIFGRDVAISQDMAPAKTEQAYLPIMGMVKGDNALLAVATEGAAYATARATVSGQKSTSYNSAWFTFSLRSIDTYYMGGSNASALNAYEQGIIPESRLTVRYYPIVKEDASFVDVAHRYQKYLIDHEGLTKKADKEEAPLYLDLFGGTVKQQSVLGFPVSLETPATTYKQAKEIVEQLANLGVGDMIITYNDFNKAGITSRISNSVDYSGTLGGKNDFLALRQYCDGIGAKLAPSVDLMEYERSGNGYSKTGASAIAVTKAYATQNVYERAFGTPHDTRSSWYILTPAYYERVYNQVITSYLSENMAAISVANGTNLLYSDFTANTTKKSSRQQAVENLKNCYSMINNSGMTFVSDAANAYALPYVDYLKDVPLYSSNFDVYDYDIPFYEVVIHGYIPYTTKAKNASSSADELFLYSVATGTPLHYEVMYEDPNEFTDCTYDTLFYTHYKGWLNIAAGEYALVQDHVKPLVNDTITDFKFLDAKVVETTFQDPSGTVTVIQADLANQILKVNGTEIDLANYVPKGATTN